MNKAKFSLFLKSGSSNFTCTALGRPDQILPQKNKNDQADDLNQGSTEPISMFLHLKSYDINNNKKSRFSIPPIL